MDKRCQVIVAELNALALNHGFQVCSDAFIGDVGRDRELDDEQVGSRIRNAESAERFGNLILHDI